MKRGRQPPRRRTAATVAVGADEPERAVATQGMLESCAAAEIEEVGAASHGDVLTGVDEPTRDGIVERCGPAAGTPPALEDRHREPRIEEPSRCGQASEPLDVPAIPLSWVPAIIRLGSSGCCAMV